MTEKFVAETGMMMEMDEATDEMSTGRRLFSVSGYLSV
jgi:hypothetical protein